MGDVATDYVKSRCREWAKAVSTTGGKGTSIIAQAMMYGGVLARSTGGEEPLSLDVLEVERAVLSKELPEVWKVVFLQEYFGVGSSSERAKRVGVRRDLYYRLLDNAHTFVGEQLSGSRAT